MVDIMMICQTKVILYLYYYLKFEINEMPTLF